MKDRLITLSPFSYLDYEYLESWLTDMASQGWFIEHYGFFRSVFKRGEPSNRIYRVVPRATSSIKDEEIAIFEASGWKFFDSIRSLAIYYNEDPNAEEFFDPEAFKKYSRNYLVLLLIWIPFCVYWIYKFAVYAGSFLTGFGTLNIINDNGIIFYLSLSVGIIFALVAYIRAIYLATSQYLRIKREIKVRHNKQYRKRALFNNIVNTGLIITVVACILSSIFVTFNDERGHIQLDEALNYSESQPYLLREFSPEEWNYIDVESPSFDSSQGSDGRYYSNGEYYIRKNPNILFSKSVTERYEYSVEDATVDEYKSLYYVQYNSSYYEARSEWIAEKFIEELPGYLPIRDAEYKNVSLDEMQVPCDNVDYAGYNKGEGDYQEIIIRKGKQIIYIGYNGKKDLKAEINKIAATL